MRSKEELKLYALNFLPFQLHFENNKQQKTQTKHWKIYTDLLTHKPLQSQIKIIISYITFCENVKYLKEYILFPLVLDKRFV